MLVQYPKILSIRRIRRQAMNFKNGKTLQIVQKIVDPNDPNLFSVVIKGVKTQERIYM